jgi:hypothetical protein
LIEQKPVPGTVPQVMMGIDDLQLRLDDFLLPQREPGRIRIMRIVG